jgi:hypothetical protein
MSDKSCSLCQNYRREQVGPHEWTGHCALHQRDFPAVEHCNFYQPEPGLHFDEDERWPARKG